MHGSDFVANLFNLKGKVAMVTGARRGLGLGMAVGLVKAGAKLVGVSSHPDCEELSGAVRAARGELLYICADLTCREQRRGLVGKAVERFGRLDILVNNAGIQHREPAMEFDIEKWDAMVSLMLTGVFELCQQAARIMVGQGGGKIINIASVVSFQGGWLIPAYAAVKHGVVGITRALANEWAARNINVNAIAPGYFDTDMCRAIKTDPVREPKIRERIPAGRWGKPEDLIGPLLFLASDASNYVHGHVLAVDGGWLAR
ncbi:MAG: SDR family oxidoreductase [Kiritimatiellae bacterium]|nr:SDR family oxidoreductase [Kiritimatiellia bacterium]